MALTAAIIVPTRERAGYLARALASIGMQARDASVEVLVVDDGPDAQTRAAAQTAGARYIAHERSLGLNAARNTAIAATEADWLFFVDDDVEVHRGWLAALLAAARSAGDDVGVLAGPIHARIDNPRYRQCGREGAPITFLDSDRGVGWGANLGVRRSWVERVGPFDAARELYGDEQEWQARVTAAGGRIRYVAGAALDHRRAGDDARLRSLCRAAYRRGLASRRFDAFKGTAPSLASELRVLAGCLLHGPRRACMNGPVLAAHSLGRLRAALAAPAGASPAEDFLSGTSGTVGGKRGALLRARDAWLDVREAPRRARLRRAARSEPPRRRVLVVGVDRPGSLMDAARAELMRSRHAVDVVTAPQGERGKFENLNALLAAHPPAAYDWLLVIDDDVALPRGFLDAFLCAAERTGLKLAQPAHRLHSHAAWPVTRRQPGATARETTFVEIGPVTAFHRDSFEVLLPFPEGLPMGWGLDVHWAAIAAEHGWPIGIVDATPIGHTQRPAGSGYARDAAQAQARAFLADRPYVRRDEVRTLAVHR
jgi:GT2 family glycosyltransferase